MCISSPLLPPCGEFRHQSRRCDSRLKPDVCRAEVLEVLEALETPEVLEILEVLQAALCIGQR